MCGVVCDVWCVMRGVCGVWCVHVVCGGGEEGWVEEGPLGPPGVLRREFLKFCATPRAQLPSPARRLDPGGKNETDRICHLFRPKAMEFAPRRSPRFGFAHFPKLAKLGAAR